MTTVRFIGRGHIGSTVARLSLAAGHQVVLSNSRGPATPTDLVAELGPLARAATAEEAAAAGDIVVVTIPFKAYQSVPAEPLAGKLVLDTWNYSQARDGHVEALDDGVETRSEPLAHQLPAAEVVKVFSNIFCTHLLSLSRPAGAADRSYLPIAGTTRTRRPRRLAPWTRSATARLTPEILATAGASSQARLSTDAARAVH